MTKKMFWSNPYQFTHTATVKTVASDDITLDSTIFFAFSGGQESDSGSIHGVPVISASKQQFEIVYTVQPGHVFFVGQSVVVQIDWARRHRLMRLHFAAELVLELIYQELKTVDKVGAHIAEHKARIDFAWPQSIAPLLPLIAERANDIIGSDVEIITGFEDEATERRYWEIAGFTRVPCGGTHVRRTGEIGNIRLKRDNIGKGKERVELYLEDSPLRKTDKNRETQQ
jgi:alanyl-tRNA synthetase